MPTHIFVLMFLPFFFYDRNRIYEMGEHQKCLMYSIIFKSCMSLEIFGTCTVVWISFIEKFKDNNMIIVQIPVF